VARCGGTAAAYFWCDVGKTTITLGCPVQNTRWGGMYCLRLQDGRVTMLKDVRGITSHVRHTDMCRRWCEGTGGHVAVAGEMALEGGSSERMRGTSECCKC
jgi:hypothetical protein